MAADLAKAMEILTLLNQSGRLQQMVQEIGLMSRRLHRQRLILFNPCLGAPM